MDSHYDNWNISIYTIGKMVYSKNFLKLACNLWKYGFGYRFLMNKYSNMTYLQEWLIIID